MKILYENSNFSIVTDETVIIINGHSPSDKSILAISGLVLWANNPLPSQIYYFDISKHKFPYEGLMNYIIKQEKLDI